MIWSVGQVLGINLAMAGLQFCFACYCVLNTPFLSELKIPAWMTSAIMVIGPVAGFLVQPVVGYMSDRSTSSMGRRRPFVIFGAIMTAVSQIWMGMSAEVASLFCERDTDAYYLFAQIWAIFGVAFVNIFINVELASFRSLIADCVPPEAQNKGATYSGFMMGASFVLCNVIMISMYETNPEIRYGEVYPLLSTIAALATVALVIPSVFIAVETPMTEKPAGKENVFKNLFVEFKRMDSIFYIAMMPLLFGWIGYTPIQQFTGTVFDMETTIISQICLNGVTTIISPILGSLVDVVGERLLFFICGVLNIISTVILILSGYFPDSFVADQWCVCVAMSLIGFINCAMNTIPFIYVGKLAPPQSKGLYSGVFNCVIVIGQAIANLLLTVVNAIAPPKTGSINTNPLWIAGVLSVITAASTLALKDSAKIHKYNTLDEEEKMIQ